MTLIKSISGIRGTIGGQPGSSLTPLDVVKYAAGYGAWLAENAPETGSRTVVIGRDARPTGKVFSQMVGGTLQAMGYDILDLGLSTTPTVELAVMHERALGGIILSASHNPNNWNALKLLNASGEFLSAQNGERVLQLAEEGTPSFVSVQHFGRYQYDESWIDKHIQLILDLPLVDVEAIRARNFRVMVDCVNSSGGIALPPLLKALGVEHVEELYCEPNGRFPHNPEPLPENLSEIMNKMEAGNYHLGIVVDPDVDRLAFICEDGTYFGEEYTLVAVADYVLKHTPGNTVSNMSSTRALRDITEKAGMSYQASPVGEVHVVEAMKACQAVIGGEGNGGIIYPPLHYGRDALVGIALFLSHLATHKGTTKMLRLSYPNYFLTKHKIELTPEIDVDYVLAEIADKYKNQPIHTTDGVKVEFDKEWVHLRKSNTEPIIRIYSEAETPAISEHLAKKIMADIKEIIAQRLTDTGVV